MNAAVLCYANSTDLHSFYGDPAFADLKIKFSNQEILAHKVIVCRKSEFFYKACTSPFKVRYSKESYDAELLISG